MGNINLSFGNNVKKPTSKSDKEKVILTYHNGTAGTPEYYSYINKDGKEEIFNDKTYTISKISATKYIAKKVSLSKVPLEFIPSKDPVEYQPGYFTYNDNKLYLDKPTFDEERNTYVGILNIVNTYDKEIKLYKEN